MKKTTYNVFPATHSIENIYLNVGSSSWIFQSLLFASMGKGWREGMWITPVTALLFIEEGKCGKITFHFLILRKNGISEKFWLIENNQIELSEIVDLLLKIDFSNACNRLKVFFSLYFILVWLVYVTESIWTNQRYVCEEHLSWLSPATFRITRFIYFLVSDTRRYIWRPASVGRETDAVVFGTHCEGGYSRPRQSGRR